MKKDRTFKLLVIESGLKNRKVAEIIGRDIESVRSYSCGRRPCPEELIDRLRVFVANQKEIIKKIENK